ERVAAAEALDENEEVIEASAAVADKPAQASAGSAPRAVAEPAPQEAPPAKPAAKAQAAADKPASKPQAPADQPAPKSPDADAALARALLEGKTAPVAAREAPREAGKFVVQVAALASR